MIINNDISSDWFYMFDLWINNKHPYYYYSISTRDQMLMFEPKIFTTHYYVMCYVNLSDIYHRGLRDEVKRYVFH